MKQTLGKEHMGSALTGSTMPAIFRFVDRGTFWVLPLTYFDLPKSSRVYLFPQSVRIHYFFSDPVSVEPICPQPIGVNGKQTDMADKLNNHII